MKLEVGDIVRWSGLKAQITLIYDDSLTARLVLFPQPGVQSATRYRDAPLSALTPWVQQPTADVAGLRELVGHRCRCVFTLPISEWPFEGYPAWVHVDAVDLPLIKLRSYGTPRWVNAECILIIERSD